MKTQWFYYSPDPDDPGNDTSHDDDNTDDSSGNSSSSTEDSSSPVDDSTDSTGDSNSNDSSDTSTDSDQLTDSSSDSSSSDDPSTTGSTEESGTQNQDADNTTDQSSDNSSDTDTTSGGDDLNNQSSDSTASDTQMASGSAGTAIAAPTQPYSVESWRSLATQFAGDIPVEVLLRWIKHESGGNPCSTGKIVNGASIENGLFQLYSPDDDHFATPAQLHGSFCNGQTCTRNLTLDEAKIQVTSGIAYVKSCRERTRRQLSQQGLEWDETGSDFWSMVKMQHNLPSIPAKYIPKLKPSSWSEFKNGVIGQEPKYKGSSIFSNAEDIGSAATI